MKNKLFKDWPLVSVYIISKNHEKFVKQAIQSVIKQTYLNWELYVIDDNSTDKSFEIAKSFKKNKKINLIKFKINFGLQKIANQILKKAKGKYFIISRIEFLIYFISGVLFLFKGVGKHKIITSTLFIFLKSLKHSKFFFNISFMSLSLK